MITFYTILTMKTKLRVISWRDGVIKKYLNGKVAIYGEWEYMSV